MVNPNLKGYNTLIGLKKMLKLEVCGGSHKGFQRENETPNLY
jgi:hypothetical protein